MPARKKAVEPKLTVSPEPDQDDNGGAPAPETAPQDDAPVDGTGDVTVIIPDVMEAGTTPAPTGTGTTPAPAAPAAAPTAGAPAAHATTPGASTAYDHSYGIWVVPAPAAASAAPVGSSGYYMGIKLGVDPTPGVYAMLGTSEPRAAWPN